MTYTFRCEIASGSTYAAGEIPPPNSGDWTNAPLGDRMLGFSMSRGKSDDQNEFDASTATIVLDNSDDEMDPLVSGSIMESVWVQWVPVRVVADDGLQSWPIWAGFAKGVSPTGPNRFASDSITITAIDWIGWGSQFKAPSGWEGSVRHGLDPLLWWRGRTDLVYREEGDTGGTLFDEIGVRDGDIGGDAKIVEAEGLIPGDDAKAIRVYGDASHQAPIVAPSSPELPSTNEWSVICAVKSPASSYSLVRSTISGTLAWSVTVDSSGNVVAIVCDSGGATVATATTFGVDLSDNNAYVVEAKFKTSATRSIQVYVWAVDDWSIPGSAFVTGFGSGAVGGGGRVTYGPITNEDVFRLGDLIYSEVNPGVGNTSVPTFADAWGLGGSGDLDDTLDNIESVAACTIPRFLTWSFTDASDGVRRDYHPVADTITDTVIQIANCQAGAVWCERTGRLRLRNFAALADVGWAQEYSTSIAKVTDEEAATGPPIVIRPGNRGRSPAREDRIINDMVFTRSDFTGGSEPIGGARAIDLASQAAYGVRRKDVDIIASRTAEATAVCQDAADDIIARYAQPPVEINEVTIKPFSDSTGDLLDWCVQDLDLERAVTYTETTPGGVVVIDGDFRVIREKWDWNGGTDLTVTFGLAPA